jgi:RNA polymerase sigma-70 factor (ECF subfamily)
MDNRTDEAIALAVQAGDHDAFGILISRYEDKLARYGRRFLQRQDAIEDTVQDVFIKAFINIQSFQTTLRFSPWIYRIAHNTFVNELRRTQRTYFFDFDTDTFLPALTAPETADGATLEDELREHLDELIATLPSKYREVLVLHYSEAMSYQEISDILHVPVSTVGVRLNRARQQLKARYEANQTHHD